MVAAGADQDVAVVYVAQFVGQHAFQFFVRQQTQNSVGHSYGGVAGIASRGEGVWRFGRDYINLRHRDADLLGQALDNLVRARELLAGTGWARYIDSAILSEKK